MASVQVAEDYYAILGVEMTADTQVIKTAYHKLAKITHPDRNPSPNGKEQFQKLQAAYETLSDSTERRKYDITRLFCTNGIPEGMYGEMQARAEAQTELAMLQAQWTKEDRKLFNTRQEITNLETEIAKLKQEHTADAKEWTRQAPWLGSIAAALFGIETPRYRAAKKARQRRRLDQITALHEKIQEKERKTESLRELETAVYTIGKMILKMKRRYTKMQDWREEMAVLKASESQARAKMREEEIKLAREAEGTRKQRQQQQQQEKKDEGVRARAQRSRNVREVGRQT